MSQEADHIQITDPRLCEDMLDPSLERVYPSDLPKIIRGAFHENPNKPELYRAGENKLIVALLDLGAASQVVVPGREKTTAPIGVVVHVGPGVWREGHQKVAPFVPGDWVVIGPTIIGALPDTHKRDRYFMHWENVLAVLDRETRSQISAAMFQKSQIQISPGV